GDGVHGTVRSFRSEHASVVAQVAIIDAERPSLGTYGVRQHTLTNVCSWLAVSSSGYYEWRSRPESATAQRRRRLKALIVVIFDYSDETYGHRRLHAELARQGQRCSLDLVRGLMREVGLVPCQPRPWRHSLTDADPAAGAIPD